MAEQNFSAESVFRFLRTNLTGFTGEELDLLENYVLALGIRGYKKWQEKWIRRAKDTTEEDLEVLNHLRVRFVEKTEDLVFVLKQRQKTVRDVTLAICEFLEKEEIQKQVNSNQNVSAGGASSGDDRDVYFVDAGKFIIEKDKASIGMLQRVFKIGFNRAARIMDQLAEAGVVGEEEGTKPRKVLMSMEQFEQYIEESV